MNQNDKGVSELASLKQLALAAEKDGHHVYTHPRDSNKWHDNADWHVAAKPEVFLKLIEQVESLSHSAATGKVPEDEILAAAQQRMWEALDRRACPGPWMQIASDAIFDFKKDSYGAALASPAAPLAGKAEPVAIYQVSTKHGFAWCDVSREVYDQYEGLNYSRRIVYSAPLASAVLAEEASEQRMKRLENFVRSAVDDLERIHLALGLPADDTVDADVMIEHIARLSKPTAQGAAQSIDTPEFRETMVNFGYWVDEEEPENDECARDIIAHINRHIAAQAPAGRDAEQE